MTKRFNSKKEFLDYLYYEVGKQNCNFELTILSIDGAKSQWLTYLDAQADNYFIEKANNRTILDIEVVLDLDPKDNETPEETTKRFKQLLDKLNKDELSYKAYYTGSRGYHIHLIFDELKNFDKSTREKIKEYLIRKYDCDTMKKSERCMIALEYTDHWKTNNPKHLIREIEGTNNLNSFLEEFKKEEVELSIKEEIEQLKHKIIESKQQGIYNLAAYFLKEYRIITFSDTDEIFIYNDGVYIGGGDKKISSEAQKLLGDLSNTNIINELLGHIKRSTYTKRESVVEPKNRICLKNEILNHETLDIEPHSPEFFFFNKLPVSYDKNADCPKIRKFLREVVPEDSIPVLQEMAGYCLYKEYPIHKALMLVGTGYNGKSTYINLLKVFLGQENCSAEPLHQLETNRFAVASLFGKLANLFADLPARALQETSFFKMLTGQDLIPAEQKFRNRFSFLNYAKQIYSCNQIPRSPDDTDAFFRRWVIINFPNQFKGKADDKQLIKKLTTDEELSGFLNFAIEGLRRLLEHEDFSNTKTVDEIREEYIRKSDSVHAFVMDCVMMNSESHTEKKQLYTEYADYCRYKNYPTAADNTFHKELAKKVRVEDYRPLIDGHRVQCWKGIKVDSSKLKLEKSPDSIDRVDTTNEIIIENNVDRVDTENYVRDVNDVKAKIHLNSKITLSDDDYATFVKEKEPQGYNKQEYTSKYGEDVTNRLLREGRLYENPAGTLRTL